MVRTVLLISCVLLASATARSQSKYFPPSYDGNKAPTDPYSAAGIKSDPAALQRIRQGLMPVRNFGNEDSVVKLALLGSPLAMERTRSLYSRYDQFAFKTPEQVRMNSRRELPFATARALNFGAAPVPANSWLAIALAIVPPVVLHPNPPRKDTIDFALFAATLPFTYRLPEAVMAARYPSAPALRVVFPVEPMSSLTFKNPEVIQAGLVKRSRSADYAGDGSFAQSLPDAGERIGVSGGQSLPVAASSARPSAGNPALPSIRNHYAPSGTADNASETLPDRTDAASPTGGIRPATASNTARQPRNAAVRGAAPKTAAPVADDHTVPGGINPANVLTGQPTNEQFTVRKSAYPKPAIARTASYNGQAPVLASGAGYIPAAREPYADANVPGDDQSGNGDDKQTGTTTQPAGRSTSFGFQNNGKPVDAPADAPSNNAPMQEGKKISFRSATAPEASQIQQAPPVQTTAPAASANTLNIGKKLTFTNVAKLPDPEPAQPTAVNTNPPVASSLPASSAPARDAGTKPKVAGRTPVAAKATTATASKPKIVTTASGNTANTENRPFTVPFTTKEETITRRTPKPFIEDPDIAPLIIDAPADRNLNRGDFPKSFSSYRRRKTTPAPVIEEPAAAAVAPSDPIVNVKYPKLNMQIRLANPKVKTIDDLKFYLTLTNNSPKTQKFLFDRPVQPGFAMWGASCKLSCSGRETLLRSEGRPEYEAKTMVKSMYKNLQLEIKPYEWFIKKFNATDIVVIDEDVCKNGELPEGNYTFQLVFQGNYSNVVHFTVKN